MALTTTSLVRLVSDLTTSDIGDTDLANLIAEATRLFWKDISIRVEWEEVDGKINGSNREYKVANNPFAPTGSTTTVSINDITVYSIQTNATTGFEESSELTVSTVYSRDGRFIVSSAPASEIDEIRANYAYTSYWLDWDKVSLAVAYLTANLAYQKVLATGEIESVKFKDLSISSGAQGREGGTQAESMMTLYRSTINSMLPPKFQYGKIRPAKFLDVKKSMSLRKTLFP